MKWRHIKDPSKYRAKKVIFDGYKFDSQYEAERYKELRLLEKAKQISQLEVHPYWLIVIGEVHICRYVADFSYFDIAHNWRVEDVKGAKTREYRLKKKLMLALHGIRIIEIEVPRRLRRG